MTELKRCPFCGSEQKFSNENEVLPYLGEWRTCDNCELEMHSWNTRPIEDELNARIAQLTAEIARRDEELLELNDKAVFIKFENEDELPAGIKDDVYSAMFECSHVDGVRLFPYIEENGQKYFLVMLKEVV